MQPLVPLVLPSLYPPSNDFLYLFYPFLTVLNAPSKTMLQKRDVDTSLMQHAGIELGSHRYDATTQIQCGTLLFLSSKGSRQDTSLCLYAISINGNKVVAWAFSY